MMTVIALATQPVLAAGTPLLTFLLPIAGSMLLCYGVYQIVVESRTASQKKIEERLKGVKRPKSDKESAVSILRRNAVGDSKSVADKVLGKLSFMPRVQVLLDQADVDWSASALMARLFTIAVIAVVALVLMGFNLWTGLMCGLAVIFLPLFWLSYKKKARVAKLTAQLPDVFEMMSQALRAGHSLASAVHLIHEQMPNPISSEFGRVYHEQNLGLKLEDALVGMAERLDSLDVKFFVTAVQIQRSTGGDLAEVIDKIGAVIRSRIELFGLVKGLTAEGRLSGYVLFALPMITFAGAMMLNPAYARILIDDPRGQIMLVIAGGMQLMGLAMIRWIVNIKV
ncbi:MAG: pilus assembly protein TadB [Phycisphaerales bacterium]|nr:MAG: pilus assembly protein TadB [Phycisphaerales bacterium]